jgi:hypothetical protein
MLLFPISQGNLGGLPEFQEFMMVFDFVARYGRIGMNVLTFVLCLSMMGCEDTPSSSSTDAPATKPDGEGESETESATETEAAGTGNSDGGNSEGEDSGNGANGSTTNVTCSATDGAPDSLSILPQNVEKNIGQGETGNVQFNVTLNFQGGGCKTLQNSDIEFTMTGLSVANSGPGEYYATTAGTSTIKATYMTLSVSTEFVVTDTTDNNNGDDDNGEERGDEPPAIVSLVLTPATISKNLSDEETEAVGYTIEVIDDEGGRFYKSASEVNWSDSGGGHITDDYPGTYRAVIAGADGASVTETITATFEGVSGTATFNVVGDICDNYPSNVVMNNGSGNLSLPWTTWDVGFTVSGTVGATFHTITSSDDRVGTVSLDIDGGTTSYRFQPVGLGTTTISVVVDQNPCQKNSFDITVTEPTIVDITVSGPFAEMVGGYKMQLQATGQMSNGTVKNVTEDVIWTTAGGSSTVNDTAGSKGIVTAKATGSSYWFDEITATGPTGSPPPARSFTIRFRNQGDFDLQTIAIFPFNPVLPIGLAKTFTAVGTFKDDFTNEIWVLGRICLLYTNI